MTNRVTEKVDPDAHYTVLTLNIGTPDNPEPVYLTIDWNNKRYDINSNRNIEKVDKLG